MAIATRPAMSVAGMLQSANEKGVSVDALEKLTSLYERMQDRDAKKDFVAALMAFQAEAKQIKANKPVPNNDGSIRYKFAPFEDIMEQVQPMAQKHGFIITFSSDIGDGKVTKICKLTHTSGHASENSYTARVGKGPPGSSETQADGAAHQYAKRGALCDALNIVIDKDGDSRNLGAFIAKEQAADLKRRVRESGADEIKFLAFAQARTFEEIHESMYAALDANLRKKESTR